MGMENPTLEKEVKGLRTLLLDDERVICDFIKREVYRRDSFKGQFINVPTGTGREAIEILSEMETPPELIFVDLRLNNGLTGFDVIDWLLDRFDRDSMVIVILTGCWEGSQDWEKSIDYLNNRKIDALIGKWGIGEVQGEINKILDHLERSVSEGGF